jgi:hypothetical protein
MQGLTRPLALKIAALLALPVALFAIVMYDVPSLMLGAQAIPDSFWLVLGSFASDILALVAAYGLWRGQRWGIILMLGVLAYWTMQAIFGLLFAESSFDIAFSSGMLVHHVIVVALCLWPARQPAAHST